MVDNGSRWQNVCVRPDRLVQRLVALPETRMRVLALVQALAEGDPNEWVSAMVAVLDAAHSGRHPDAAKAREAITHAAGAQELSYLTRQRIYEAAVQLGHREIARLFFVASPPTVDPREVARQTAPERALERRSRPLTLGERKSLARTHRRDRLALVVKDPHPAVISILLSNPHVTEQDIVTIAATRHALPDTLALLAAHPVWAARYPIKRALALNPATPLAAAIRIATTLTSKDLRELRDLSSSPSALREHARAVLERRGAITPLS
jgi:hypothetical protein